MSQPVVRDAVEWDEYTGRLVAVQFVEVRAHVSGSLQSVHSVMGGGAGNKG